MVYEAEWVVLQALDVFRDAMYDLYMGPRLREPVWLSMMSNVSYRYSLCERFMHEFMFLATKYDNKSTKLWVALLFCGINYRVCSCLCVVQAAASVAFLFVCLFFVSEDNIV